MLRVLADIKGNTKSTAKAKNTTKSAAAAEGGAAEGGAAAVQSLSEMSTEEQAAALATMNEEEQAAALATMDEEEQEAALVLLELLGTDHKQLKDGGADTSTGADMYKQYAQQAQAEGRAPLPSARPPSHASDTEILGWFRGLPQQPQGSTSTGADLYKQYAQQAQAEGRAPLPPAAAAAEDGADGADTAGRTLPQLAGSPQLFFTYGSLKSNFPNHNPTSALLGKLVGACSTVDKLPLIVPKIPSCSNSACGFLHRIAALVHRPGTGHCVHGELYEVDPDGLIQLDKQQQYLGPAEASNVHDRLLVEVKMEDGAIKQAHCYFSTDAGNATPMYFTRKLSLLVSRSAKVKPFQCMLNQASQL